MASTARHPALTRSAAMLLALGAMALPACRTNSAENDRLRGENIQLKNKISDLNQQLERRLAEIRILEDRDPSKQSKVEGAEVPRAVSLSFARYSGFFDGNGDGNDDSVRIYLHPVDQQGRFLPSTGKAELQAVFIKAGQSPRTIITKSFSPQEFSDAYRSGLTGTHFTLEAPLPTDLPDEVKEVTVKVTFTDAVTGGELTRERPMSIRRIHRNGPATQP